MTKINLRWRRGNLITKSLAVSVLWLSGTFTLRSAPEMSAHFISVGQADSTLLEFPCGAILIDAGTDDEHAQALTNYLANFFQRRADLTNTLQAVFITHNHIDHTAALPSIFDAGIRVLRYFDNSVTNQGSGAWQQAWIRDQNKKRAKDHSYPTSKIRGIRDREISKSSGLTDSDIDPLVCTDYDPRVTLLAGRKLLNPGWKPDDWANWNNQSLVIRIDFGEHSLLFTGDLEEPAIATLLKKYEKNLKLLDADIYHVGHHGSNNGTTDALLKAVSPELAVISAGRWNSGMFPWQHFSTFTYGHPRQQTIGVLSRQINRTRGSPLRAAVALGQGNFVTQTITNAIYATGWEGTLVARVPLHGPITITAIDPPPIVDPPALPAPPALMLPWPKSPP